VQRTLRLRFGGAAFASGKVPLTTVASKLQALQDTVFHATATVAQDRRARRGLWTNRYRKDAELVFVDSHHSQLEIEAELPPPPGVLFGDARREGLGDRALRLVFEFGAAATRGRNLQRLVADREERLFLLKALEAMCPATAEDYQIELFSGRRDGERLDFSTDTRERLRSLVENEQTWTYGNEEESIVGDLTKIHVDPASQMIAVRLGRRTAISCYFDDAMREQVMNLLPGSKVEVTGWPVRDAKGQLRQLDGITNVQTVSMEPQRFSRFEHEGRRYELKEPLTVLVEHSEGTWIYHNEEINLWGYARRRADAIRELHEAFDYLWHSFAEEDDDVLDPTAQLLKRKLRAMVARGKRGR
jgi:hypothetical protein